MYITWPNLPSLRYSRWPLWGGTARSRGGGRKRGGRNRGKGGHGGLTERDGKPSAGMIKIMREIDEYNGQTTDD